MNSLPDTQIVLQILLSVGIIVIAAKYLGVRAKKIGGLYRQLLGVYGS